MTLVVEAAAVAAVVLRQPCRASRSGASATVAVGRDEAAPGAARYAGDRIRCGCDGLGPGPDRLSGRHGLGHLGPDAVVETTSSERSVEVGAGSADGHVGTAKFGGGAEAVEAGDSIRV